MAQLNEEKDGAERFRENEQALKNERRKRQDAELRLEEMEKKLRKLMEKNKLKDEKEQREGVDEEKEIRVSFEINVKRMGSSRVTRADTAPKKW